MALSLSRLLLVLSICMYSSIVVIITAGDASDEKVVDLTWNKIKCKISEAAQLITSDAVRFGTECRESDTKAEKYLFERTKCAGCHRCHDNKESPVVQTISSTFNRVTSFYSGSLERFANAKKYVTEKARYLIWGSPATTDGAYFKRRCKHKKPRDKNTMIFGYDPKKIGSNLTAMGQKSLNVVINHGKDLGYRGLRMAVHKANQTWNDISNMTGEQFLNSMRDTIRWVKEVGLPSRFSSSFFHFISIVDSALHLTEAKNYVENTLECLVEVVNISVNDVLSALDL